MRRILYLKMSLVFLVITLEVTFAQTELWGLTSGPSSVFKVTDSGANYSSTIFGLDPAQGAWPQGSLVEVSNHKLYGVASGGVIGSNNTYLGVIFEFDPSTRVYKKKWNFNTATGANPTGNLVLGPNGKLYGMTNSGGANGFGVIFEFDPTSGVYLKRVDFATTNGFIPLGNSLVLATNTKFYGMTNGGGSFGFGVIFEFDPLTGVYKKLIDFDGVARGKFPHGDLIEATNGKFYGITINGGNNDQGVLFEFDPSTSIYTKKIDFQRLVNGAYPFGSLVQAKSTKLYGRTGLGGVANNGVLFEFDCTTGSLIVRAEFNATITGNEARGAMVESTNGRLYGMNSTGGAFNAGVLYEYNTESGALTKKHDFNLSTGGEPRGSLIVVTRAKEKLNQAITFNPIGSKTFSNTPLVLMASTTSNLPIEFTSSEPTIASIQGDRLTMLMAGTVTITAEQSGDATFNPAVPVSQRLLIERAEQTIRFDSISTKVVGDSPVVLVATSSSGLPLTYISSNPMVASINKNVATILNMGSVVITAAQLGNSSYLPALEVSRVLKINERGSLAAEISVYPNPTYDSIKVYLGQSLVKAQLTIFQLNGSKKFDREIYANKITIDVSGYRSGVYVLKIVVGEYIETKRFIKL